MKTYIFMYREENYGIIQVQADNFDDAWDLAQCGEGDIHIYKSDWEIGDEIKK